MKIKLIINALKDKMSTNTTTTTNVSLSNFAASVEKLDATGSNWFLFQSCFLVAMEQKEVIEHFNGSSVKPTLGEGSPTETESKVHAKLLAAWQKKEQLGHYLLIQKLLDSTYTKYVRKTTVAEMWEVIVTKFTHKSMYMQSNLQQEFMSMRAQKGADLHSEFDRVRIKYETLLSVGIEISDNDYCSLIINFVPPELSSVLAQMSMNMKQVTTSLLKVKVILSVTKLKGKLPSLEVDPKDLMQATLEEWDRREADK